MKRNNLDKTYKYGSEVFIVQTGSLGDFLLVKGRICGIRQFHTAFSHVLYSVETKAGLYEILPCNIFGSIEELTEELKDRVEE